MSEVLVLSRRSLIKGTVAGGAVIAVGGSMEACNVSQWVQTALNDLPAILSAVTAIISMVGAAKGTADPTALALAQKLAAEAQADLTTAQTLISGYKAAPSDSVLQKIDAALLDAQTNLAGIEGALHITDPATQAAVSAGISAALVIIVSLQSIIPPPATPAPAPAPAVAAHVSNRRAMHAAASSNNHSIIIRTAFNEALMAAGAGKYAI
jgi:hypothetical protein